jgi:hypothetical protein
MYGIQRPQSCTPKVCCLMQNLLPYWYQGDSSQSALGKLGWQPQSHEVTQEFSNG